MSIYLFNIFNYYLNIINSVFFWGCYNSIYIYSIVQIKCIKFNKTISYYSTNLITYFSNNDYNNIDNANDDNSDNDYQKDYKTNRINKAISNNLFFIEFFGQDGKTCHELLTIPDDYTNFIERINKMYDEFYSIGVQTYFIYNQVINNKQHDRAILYNFNNVSWVNNKMQYKLSSHRFMSAQLKLTNDTSCDFYEIKLCTDDYNYYIFGNRINTDFVLYYCEQILKIKDIIKKIKQQTDLPIQYTLTIVDGDANLLNLTEDDEIIFNNDGYLLQKYILQNVNNHKKHIN